MNDELPALGEVKNSSLMQGKALCRLYDKISLICILKAQGLPWQSVLGLHAPSTEDRGSALGLGEDPTCHMVWPEKIKKSVVRPHRCVGIKKKVGVRLYRAIELSGGKACSFWVSTGISHLMHLKRKHPG